LEMGENTRPVMSPSGLVYLHVSFQQHTVIDSRVPGDDLSSVHRPNGDLWSGGSCEIPSIRRPSEFSDDLSISQAPVEPRCLVQPTDLGPSGDKVVCLVQPSLL
jgi:hypothetical protein